MKNHAVIARKTLFSSAHLYHQKKFSHEENQRIFGACYTEYGHGHNYVLEVFVSGPIDENTKLVMNLTDLDVLIKNVLKPIDHKHLNFDVPEFKDKIPTTENIALYLREKFNEELKPYPQLKLQKLKVFETDDLWAEVIG